MRVEFNSNGFSADMGNRTPQNNYADEKLSLPIKLTPPITLGVLAFIVSLLSIPFALFSNICADIITEAVKANLSRWVILSSITSFFFIAISVCLAILGIVAYLKSNRSKGEAIGVILSIISLGASILCFAINFIALL